MNIQVFSHNQEPSFFARWCSCFTSCCSNQNQKVSNLGIDRISSISNPRNIHLERIDLDSDKDSSSSNKREPSSSNKEEPLQGNNHYSKGNIQGNLVLSDNLFIDS